MPNYVERLANVQTEEIWKEIEGDQPCKDPTVYTASSISVLDRCENEYKLTFQDQVPPEYRTYQAVRGSTLHKCIDRLHKEDLWDDYGDLFRQTWEEVEGGEDADLPWRSDIEDDKMEGIKGDGETILRGYVVRNRNAKVIATEVPFRMLIEHPRTSTRYRYSGTLDQIRESAEKTLQNHVPGIYVPNASEGWLDIYDPKSNAVAPDGPFLSRNVQLTGYGLGLKRGRFLMGDQWQQPHGFFPNRLVWYQLMFLLPYKRGGSRKDGSKYVAGDMRGNPEFAVTRTPEDYEAFEVELCRKIQKIRMGLFTRQITQIGCSMCKVQNACTSGMFVKRESILEAADLSGL